jgi:hypothetical protein
LELFPALRCNLFTFFRCASESKKDFRCNRG